ncbi:hypothetical protein [Glutamicibacter sp. M10]|uniref:hypothetical protein n=1 Tax=Glutamicibacter sp. M10 TaxID=3023076 RepID=UPI0021C5F6F5|nr:hypothetical protein [Glutamicibacter sp. M10]UXN33361.1 hypothetical protein N6V40_08235 [Glutamicibacter sp. M10]
MTLSNDDRKPGLHPALSARQGFALLEESGSVRNLMCDSVKAIRKMQYVHVDGDSVFSLGSIGIEKAMKVMLSCKSVDDAGAWPSKSELIGWGHDIEKLNARLQDAIDEGLSRTTAKGYSARLAGHVRDSSVIPLVFATFARYGKSGRFHHLDILATDQPGELDDPAKYWERVELHVSETCPEFHKIPTGDDAAIDYYLKRIRGAIADELEAWWFCIHRLGVQGWFGELAKKIGWEIWEPGWSVPKSVRT